MAKKKRSKKKKSSHQGKRPLSLLIRNYKRLGKIIKARGGKV